MQCSYSTWDSFRRSDSEKEGRWGHGVKMIELEFPGSKIWCYGRKWNRRVVLPLFSSSDMSLTATLHPSTRIQEKCWKVREISEMSMIIMNMESITYNGKFRKLFSFSRRYQRDDLIIIMFACPRPLFNTGKLQVISLEALDGIIAVLSYWGWLQKGRWGIWCKWMPGNLF